MSDKKTIAALFKAGKGTYGSNSTGVTADDIYLLESDTVTTTATSITDNTIISGDGVAWDIGYVFNISDYKYNIRGITYEAVFAQKTIEASHATLNRIDTIVGTFDGNGNGIFEILKGVEATNPIKRTVDENIQIEITVREK